MKATNLQLILLSLRASATTVWASHVAQSRAGHGSKAAVPSDSVATSRVAAAFNVERRTLQRAFLSETDVHLKEYHVRLRVASALARLWKGDKVEAVALLVGWKSKKDLYRAMDRFVGLKPSAIRSLSPESLDRIMQQLHSVNGADAITRRRRRVANTLLRAS